MRWTRFYRVFATFLLATTLAGVSQAQSPRHGTRATGPSHESEALLEERSDGRLERKRPSFWRRPSEADAAAQLKRARESFANERYRRAARDANALVHTWHDAPEAVAAQLLLAQAQESAGRYRKAFDAYQYLIVFFAGRFPYAEIVERQFAIANRLRARNEARRFFSNTDGVRDMFEQVVKNAPRGERAAEAQMIVGLMFESDGNFDEAIPAYEMLHTRYPNSPEAPAAAFHAAQCRYRLARRFNRDETMAVEALSALYVLLRDYPGHPERETIASYAAAIEDQLSEKHFKQAVFYEDVRRNPAAARVAYGEFLRRFPDSPQAAEARRRLDALPADSESAVTAPEPRPDTNPTTRTAPRRPSDDP